MEKSINKKVKSSFRAVLFGCFVLLAGAIMFMHNLGFLDSDIYKYIISWQALLICLGIFFLSGGVRDNWFASLVLISIGSAFLVDEMFILDLDIKKLILPTIIIIAGLGILIRILLPKKKKRSFFDFVFFNNRKEQVNEEYLEIDKVFSGGAITINNDNFKGGNISYVFGGGDIDLRGSKLAKGINRLKIDCVFGGVNIKVPEDWDVSIESSGVFGGFSDERSKYNNQIDSSSKLIIKLDAVFGGGEIRN